jgi:restriction system protein
MAVPDFQSLMLPLLELAADGREHSLGETRDGLGVSDEERAESLPSGRQAVYDNQVSWAKVYLQQAGLLNSSRRAHFEITPRGREILREKPDRVDIKLLDGSLNQDCL